MPRRPRTFENYADLEERINDESLSVDRDSVLERRPFGRARDA